MKVQALGHVVIRVRDQERAEAFYNGILGIPIQVRMDSDKMTFFTLGDHHDFAIAVVGDEASSAAPGAPGLDHLAFKVGDRIEDLRDAKAHLAAHGIAAAAVDHHVTLSLYCHDPDGNVVELYIDASDSWKTDPNAVVAVSKVLEL